jgi:hypothetical protein
MVELALDTLDIIMGLSKRKDLPISFYLVHGKKIRLSVE